MEQNSSLPEQFRTQIIQNYIKSSQKLNTQKSALAKLINLQNGNINNIARNRGTGTSNDHDIDINIDPSLYENKAYMKDMKDQKRNRQLRELEFMFVNHFDKQNIGNRKIEDLLETEPGFIGPKIWACLKTLLDWYDCNLESCENEIIEKGYEGVCEGDEGYDVVLRIRSNWSKKWLDIGKDFDNLGGVDEGLELIGWGL